MFWFKNYRYKKLIRKFERGGNWHVTSYAQKTTECVRHFWCAKDPGRLLYGEVHVIFHQDTQLMTADVYLYASKDHPNNREKYNVINFTSYYTQDLLKTLDNYFTRWNYKWIFYV